MLVVTAEEAALIIEEQPLSPVSVSISAPAGDGGDRCDGGDVEVSCD